MTPLLSYATRGSLAFSRQVLVADYNEIGQSAAIERYVARSCDLMGSDPVRGSNLNPHPKHDHSKPHPHPNPNPDPDPDPNPSPNTVPNPNPSPDPNPNPNPSSNTVPNPEPDQVEAAQIDMWSEHVRELKDKYKAAKARRLL